MNRFLPVAFWRKEDGLHVGPAFVHSVSDHSIINAEEFGNFRQRAFFSANFNYVRIAAIVVLLLAIGPLHIAWKIPQAIVDSFYHQPWRAGTQIRQEIFEKLPPIADFDSARPVILERSVGWFFAPITHVNPRLVCATVTAPRVTVRHLVHVQPLHASTGAGVTVFQFRVGDNFGSTAIAFAEGSTISVSRRPNTHYSTADDYQFPESSSRFNNFGFHIWRQL